MEDRYEVLVNVFDRLRTEGFGDTLAEAKKIAKQNAPGDFQIRDRKDGSIAWSGRIN